MREVRRANRVFPKTLVVHPVEGWRRESFPSLAPDSALLSRPVRGPRPGFAFKSEETS